MDIVKFRFSQTQGYGDLAAYLRNLAHVILANPIA